MTYSKSISSVSKAVEYIRQGRVVAFPTGTSYGLAADTLQGWAIQRVRNLKGRPAEKKFTICIAESLWDEYLNLSFNDKKVLDSLRNSPLTLLVKPKLCLRHLEHDGRVGLRVIDHPVMKELAEAAAVPLTATSANISEQEPCRTAKCVLKQFPGKLTPALLSLSPEKAEDIRIAEDTTYDLSLAAVLDGGDLPENEPSTLAQIVDNHIEIVRQGALSREAIEAAFSGQGK